MISDELKLSLAGTLVFETAWKNTRSELDHYQRIRTKAYYLDNNMQSVEAIELRNYIAQVIDENQLRSPFEKRNSHYFSFVKEKLFDLLCLKLNRQHTKHYLIVTQKDAGDILFILRDYGTFNHANIKIRFQDTHLHEGKIELIPFYFSPENLN